MAGGWIALEGTANTRDLGGLPLATGGVTQPARLLRSDNLQDLTASDVERLVQEYDVRDVADLRTEVEIVGEGPGPLTRLDQVEVHALSLFPAMPAGNATGETMSAALLPWRAPGGRLEHPYLGYLASRPDSVVTALKVVARSDGSTLVHCAAGKDRTGVVVAMALAEVGVSREAIVEDYALTEQRIEAILDRLRGSTLYAPTLLGPDGLPLPVVDSTPKARSMRRFLDSLDGQGGVSGWLRAHGWGQADAFELRRKLLDPA